MISPGENAREFAVSASQIQDGFIPGQHIQYAVHTRLNALTRC
jgi:hypothetical protein